MKIARVHFPLNDNDGRPIAKVHFDLQEDLIDAYGGYTSWSATGAWLGGENNKIVEPVVVYECATDNSELFKSIVVDAGIKAGQEAVYVVIDGVASIIKAVVQ